MNINPAAANALAATNGKVSTSTERSTRSRSALPTRSEAVIRKSENITPSPQRIFAPTITDPSIQDKIDKSDLSNPQETTTLRPSDGVFDFGGKRDQGPAKRTLKAMPNLQEITQFFTRKSDQRKPASAAGQFSIGTNDPLQTIGARKPIKQTNAVASAITGPTTLSNNDPNQSTDADSLESLPHELLADPTTNDVGTPPTDVTISDVIIPCPNPTVPSDPTTTESSAIDGTTSDPPQITTAHTNDESSSLPQSTDPNLTINAGPKSNDNHMDDTPPKLNDPPQTRSILRQPTTPKRSTTRSTPTDRRSMPTPFNDDQDSRPLSHVKLRPARSGVSYSQASTPSAVKGKHRNVLFSPEDPEVRILDTDVATKTPPTKDAPAKSIERKNRTVFEISVKIGPNVVQVQNELRTKLLSMLSFIQKWIDPDAAFAPKQKLSTEPCITGKDSYPEVIFLLSQTYFHFNSATWYNKSQATGKMIRLSAVIAMNADPILIENAKADLNQIGVILMTKAFQEVDTSTRLAFLGAPNSMSKQYAKFIITKVLEETETDILLDDPDYDPIFHMDTLPDFAIVCMQPQGLPYVARERNEKYEPPARERRAIHIMCQTTDYDRFARLVTVAKGKGLWTQVFGMCYPTETPDMSTPDDEINRYVRMVESHQSIEMCYGSIPLTGLIRADEEFTLAKDDGTTAKVSVKKVISLVELFDSEQDKFLPVFFCTVQHDDKRFHAYYPGGNPLHKMFIAEWKKCPGPQIYYFLLKRKFLPREVSRFIRKTFSVSQQSLCAKAKYNRKTRLAYVPNSNANMDIVDAIMSPNSHVDPFLGLSDSRVKVLQAETYTGPELGAPDYFDFEEGQSITTLKNKSAQYASKLPPATDIDKRSIYEPDGSTIGDAMDVDGDDLGLCEEDDEVQLVQFDLSAIQQTQANSTPTPDCTDLVPVAAPQASQVGAYDDEAEEVAGASFAVELENLAKDYKHMISIIDDLLEEITTTDPDTAKLLHDQHTEIPDSLRNMLSSDVDGSVEAMEEYLATIRSAIICADEQDRAVRTDDPDGNFEDDIARLEQEAMEEDPSVVKPQGCTAALISPTNRNVTEQDDSETADGTSRLGASKK